MPKKPPIAQPREVTADRFVGGGSTPKVAPAPKAEPMKRITIMVTQGTHTRIKLDCVAKHVNMADAIRNVVERAWPPGRREAA
jgi:hypothetical protein